MEATAILVSISVSILVAIFLCFLPLFLSKAAEDKARARRLAEARMNARLLRFNL
jgi:hypothetical protein